MIRQMAAWAVVLLLCGLASPALATGVVPYDSYYYDHWNDAVFTPAPYVPGGSVSGVALGIGAFSGPQGLAVGPDGLVYIADTGNHRIVVLSHDLTAAVRVIDSFDNAGQADRFSSPYGVAVSGSNQLYVADTENRRIVVLEDGKLVKIISGPQSEMLDAGFVFKPLKLAVDYAGRVYAIAKGLFQGIMVFAPEGHFSGFFGTIAVKITPWQILWRAISTKEERSRQQLFIPTEFTGIDVDPGGFVYASNIDPQAKQAMRRLNPKGEDVIRKGENQNLGGDIKLPLSNSPYAGPSYVVDVAYRGKGLVSLLDSRRGRIITYDHEGNLLYIFGGLGSQSGAFKQPVAMAALGERVIALDANRNELMTFQATRYGALINEAIGLRYDGDETLAVAKWQEVLLLNENLEIANVGIGKAYLTSGDNVNAMKYLALGKNRTYYSIAFKRYRNEILRRNMPYVLSGGLFLAAAWFLAMRMKRRGKSGEQTENPKRPEPVGKLYYFKRVFGHPADAFYEIRHRERGSVPLALLCMVLFSFSFTMNRIFASFIVNDTDPRTVNGLMELSGVVLFFGLFCVGNWSVTCLMNGEGRLKDIVTVTGYSLAPLFCMFLLATLLSRGIAAGEEVFYHMILRMGVGWSAVLVLMGIMTVHNYTLAKTLATLVLTFIAMLILIFIGLLVYDLINQVIIFLSSVYTELVFRY